MRTKNREQLISNYLFTVRTPANSIYAPCMTAFSGKLSYLLSSFAIIYQTLLIRTHSDKLTTIRSISDTINKIWMIPDLQSELKNVKYVSQVPEVNNATG
jgi:hypothetical protein